MTEQDRKQFANAICTMFEVFGKKPTKIMMNGYFMALKKLTIEQVEVAVTIAMERCKFFPKPVELIEFITGGKDQLESRAIIEAGRVLESIKRVGAYKSICFDDPVTQAAISQGFGGWIKLCQDLTVDQEGWFTKDFAKIYKAYAMDKIKHYGKLSGIADTTNSASGKKIELEIVYIGNVKKAKQIEMAAKKVVPMRQITSLCKMIGNDDKPEVDDARKKTL